MNRIINNNVVVVVLGSQEGARKDLRNKAKFLSSLFILIISTAFDTDN